MHKLIVMYPAPEDAAVFLDYYEKVHMPLVAALPGIVSFHYARLQQLGPAPAPYFVLFEACCANDRDMFQALQSAQGAAVAADVANYSPRGAVMTHMRADGRSATPRPRAGRNDDYLRQSAAMFYSESLAK